MMCGWRNMTTFLLVTAFSLSFCFGFTHLERRKRSLATPRSSFTLNVLETPSTPVIDDSIDAPWANIIDGTSSDNPSHSPYS
jgi:hypothetical protein